MSEIKIVSVGTANRDQKTKNGLLLLLIGCKSPYPIVNNVVYEKYRDSK
jgi:hypothetical protein